VDLHSGEQVVFEGHPSWRGILGFYVSALVGAVVVAVIVGLLADAGLAIVVGLVLFGAALLIGFVKRVATRYVVTNQRLYIRRGLLSKRVQQTRIDRIQNVNTDQSFVERILRVGTVDFDTAGTDDSDFTFFGIASPDSVVEAVDRAQREAASSPGV
jgi:uncharacterized membrane protein YdbT with pleckstrin-like domain